MTLELLNITGCSNGSAVAVEGAKSAPAKDETEERSTMSQNKDFDSQRSGTFPEFVSSK